MGIKIGRLIPFFIKNYIRLAHLKINNPTVFIGHGVEIDPSTTIVGKGCAINAYNRISHSQIDRYTYTARNCNVMNARIGSFCSIGPGCQIGLGSHPSHFVTTSPIFYSTAGQLNGKRWVERDYYEEFSPVQIGNNVWLGANVIVMDGITIGEGAICAAGAVITKDVPPYSLVAGIPAKVIKYRFDTGTINRLLEMKLFTREEKWLKNYLTGAVTPTELLGEDKSHREDCEGYTG
ncbi:CatB-related O-acetyltransferase [Bacillus sp. es.036]|uniref:CatB-related O-acetyltransferase n=1 Tax=Bacillus sp. es.036 TaxID=1761764 RepID=UPI000BF69591|nr:CatB-related O-acetyltransferase [Bacillus sp. es.036]PFG15034.1 acetyltransferase-like isoleucine patch superfamily enzyme [Bacillus sp. es.036]